MIITIGREHGSNGHDIARELARQLGYKCYDKEIIEHAAELSGFSKEIFDSYDEKKVSAYVVPNPHYIGMADGFRLNMQVASAKFETIRTLAKEGNSIFVGRCADYVLRNRKDLVRIFIMADNDFRIKTLMKRKGIDKDRSSYYKYYTDQIWGEAENYDLCVDSSRIGIQGSVDVIRAYMDAVNKGNT